ncbi:phenol 2-monooxygenase P1 subunit [Raineyella antarctica]|uniref:propane 2-monooxygenase n=1 Tax=Raineyella antarctica TaxID=1577474 RepID=A0A1G6GHT7_9ACTN|nr:phenol hydroxylase [Raineyella antarctica]SDB81557.1 phenol 2-monooxygenase P1 subunit [Raineyella antarctica]
MQIDLRTVSIEPRRKAFDHLVRRFGDKPASRYQEGSYDLQATENLHYRPTWAPEQELYDPELSRIRMQDWQVLKDPRQYYYSTYTLTRARQQEATETNFGFVESRGLIDLVDDELRTLAERVLVPLRHLAWGANQNNTFVCGYGYGVPFTQPCMYHAMDNLGIAQYLSRLGLLFGGTEALDAAKLAWLEEDTWQGLRRLVEDLLVVRDPVELFVAQNVALDGLLYPLVYERFVDQYLAQRGGAGIAMVTQFQADWFVESRKWLDATLKAMAAESPENAAVLNEGLGHWTVRAQEALLPLARLALGDDGEGALEASAVDLAARLQKVGLTTEGGN